MANQKRYAVNQILHTNAVHLQVVLHELWRLENVEKTGFTEKELAWLKETNLRLKKASERINKLSAKVRRTP